MTDQERLEDLQEEIEILQGYKHMHGKLSEENARLRKAIEEIYELSKHDGESMYLDKCYVVARRELERKE